MLEYEMICCSNFWPVQNQDPNISRRSKSHSRVFDASASRVTSARLLAFVAASQPPRHRLQMALVSAEV